ncbi:MAG: RluA family pseudouridine synthase [Deltaproteobacteria bacterium]
MTKKRIITSTIPRLSPSRRLDRYCADRFTYLTEDQWQREILAGRLFLNNEIVLDAGTTLRGGETLTWDGSGIVEPEVDHGITIAYEDEAFVAVNKTGNLPVHPSGRYFNHTLTAILEERCGREVYPVHRLDRETSGIILLAFDRKIVHQLARALSGGTKEYLALVHGYFADQKISVDLPLGRDGESPVNKKRRAWPGGTESAVTCFSKILSAGNFSLVRCFPQTGRLHQIRAHLQSAGFPIVGDKLYGRDETTFLKFIRQGWTPELEETLMLPRCALHAARLIFVNPFTKKKMMLSAPLPGMFADFIRKQRACGR